METGNQPEKGTVVKANHSVANDSTNEPFRHTVLTPEQAAEIRGSIASARPKRTFRFHMKLVESEGAHHQIEGYASTKDLDRTGEIVEPGAFVDSLKDFMANPVVTYMHDWNNPIGKVVDVRIDEVGLFIRAEISQTAQKIWKLIEEGILRAFSIGYEVVEEKVIDGVNHILKLRLYEVAVVSIPANRRALFSVSKALEKGDDLVYEHPEHEPDGEQPRGMSTAEDSTGSAFSEDELTEAHAILEEVMEKLSTKGAAS
ncbi:MAG: HK97 family phage prohead protease [Candidatus Hydrogenedentota bacterium]|nr:MAG: HK97 family phage prohead protease [Candidatus Hydrogenedentota bacterium]